MWHDMQSEFATSLSAPEHPLPEGMMGPHQRLDVYRNNVAVSLSEALGQTFPVVKQLVGDDFFKGMAHVYIKDTKPTTPVLSEYGATFADFIQTFSPADGVPYLSDMAALEFAWLQAYHAKDADPATIERLAGIPEADLDNVTFDMHPSLFLLASSWPVASIWQAHQHTSAPDLSNVQGVAEHILIVRPAFDVAVSVLGEPAFAFASALADGGTLGQVCANLEDVQGFDPVQHLNALFVSGAISGIHFDTTL